MTIESYRAAEMQLAAEARAEQFPGLEIVIGIVRKALGVGGFELSQFEALSLDTIQRNSRGNLAYLFASLVQDVERIDLKLGAFESAGNTQREALNELISEAVVRSAEAKSKERVKRIARILAHTFRAGPRENYERERELIDAAIQVADSDASILGIMMRHQGAAVKGGMGVADVNEANRTWGRMRKENEEFTAPHIHVSCARLQAQGLIIRMDRNPTGMEMDLTTNVYSLTDFGVQFCEWCLQEVEKPA